MKKPNRIYCGACNESFSPQYGRRHFGSVAHDEAVKRGRYNAKIIKEAMDKFGKAHKFQAPA